MADPLTPDHLDFVAQFLSDEPHERATMAVSLRIQELLRELPNELRESCGPIFAGDVVEALLRVTAATMVAYNPHPEDNILPRWRDRLERLYAHYRKQHWSRTGGPHGAH
jgi:hypothetical protein